MADITGKWSATQNNGFVVQFNLDNGSDANSVTGTASTSGNTGTVSGSSVDNSIFLKVNWAAGDSVGEYVGTIATNNRAAGQTFDLSHPESQALWFSNETFPRPH